MKINTNNLFLGSCLDILPRIDSEFVDLVYLDPPFYTQRTHTLRSREGEEYSFDDSWDTLEDYLSLIRASLKECHRILKKDGCLFLHCDRSASHHLRLLLDEVFDASQFKSEIIWSYKRWSNSKRGLMNAHQVIFFYSKGDPYTFNPLYTDYSPTTNVDQILQDRVKGENGKTTYKKREGGGIVLGREKKGVPLSDVWEIPYLNPKAKERTGYPTQKPLALLKRIIQLFSNEGDVVLDPFMGSGTTCVAAKLLGREYLGIDQSEDALRIAQKRIENPIESKSAVLANGLAGFLNKSEREMAILSEIGAVAVQRNSSVDGYLKEHIEGKPVPVRIQREHETLEEAVVKLEQATLKLNPVTRIVVQTNLTHSLFQENTGVVIIPTLRVSLLSKTMSEDDLTFNS